MALARSPLCLYRFLLNNKWGMRSSFTLSALPSEITTCEIPCWDVGVRTPGGMYASSNPGLHAPLYGYPGARCARLCVSTQ